MHIARASVVGMIVMALFASMPVQADRDRRDDHRDNRRDDHRASEYQEAFRDGPCKVQRELKRDGGWKEERECKGRLPASYRHPRGEYKEKYTDGPCRVEREWKRGEFKEKIECKAHARGPRGKDKRRVVIKQPPWIVYDRGGPSYRPGWEPASAPVETAPAGRVIRCNRELIGGVIGGVAGGLLGTQIGKGSGRTAATIGGAIAGVLIGGSIGRDMDEQDQACIGQALEVAQSGQRVTWEGPRGGARYAVTPGGIEQRDDGRYCRDYETEVESGGRRQTLRGVACRQDNGVWATANR